MASISVAEQANIVLLRTKLSVPPLQPRLVPSSHLIERLNQGALGNLTLVSAPAGFGKTTLVCQWIAQQEMPVAWYSLDESDSEPSVFYRYLLTALQDLHRSLKAAFDPLLQGHTVVGQTIIANIINRFSYLNERFYLVLDDFHAIESSSIHHDIQSLLRRCPPQLHLTIITRQDPPFQLSRLRAGQGVTELKMPDLQFSLDDSAYFFHNTMQLDLPLAEIQELHSLTEGWPVGLQVVGLSLLKGNIPKGLTANDVFQNKYMLDYLFEEVFTNQSRQVQDFLLKTAVLRQLSADLCLHMTEGDYTRDMLDELERKNLFVIPLDSKSQWYRYHPLFAQMLQRRLQSTGSPSIPDLHKRASAWYADHGYLEEAFHHAFSSNDLEFAAGLVESKFMTLIYSYEWTIARRWLESLPEETLERRFLLLLYHALVVFLQEELSDITATIAELEDSFDAMTDSYSSEKRKHAEDLLLALKLNCIYYREPAEVIAAAERALRTISTRNVMARWLVQSVLSTAHIEQGDLQPAMDVVQSGLDVVGRLDPGRGNYVKVHLLNRQARLELLFGHLRAAEELLTDALEYARREDPPLRSAMAMFNITFAQVYYGKNQLDRALEHASRCTEYARPVSDIGYLLLGLKLQAFINESFGHHDLAKGIMTEALQIARQTRSSVRIASTELAAVQLAVVQSELDTVARWAAQRRLRVTEPFSRNFEKECLLMVQFEMASGRYQEAADLLFALRPRVSSRHRQTSLLTVDVLTAACLYALDRGEEALNVLASCIEFAGPEGYVRPFVENAEYLVDLLVSLCKSPKGVVRIHASELLKACRLKLNAESGGRPVIVGDSEALSQREIEILRLIFIGLTNKEIAGHSFISLNTVKTHIKNIYTKLGVTTREQAILRARELNYV